MREGWYCEQPMTGVGVCRIETVQQCPDCLKWICGGHSIRCDFCGSRCCQVCIDSHEVACADVARKGPQSERDKDQGRKRA